MITLAEYFGPWKNHPDVTMQVDENAKSLMAACEKLEIFAVADGVEFPINPVTESGVSGEQYGGFRPQSCPQGAPHSAHKEGLAVDRYDPEGRIDAWCMGHSGVGGLLEQCGIYIEHPDTTPHWSHWTIRAPGSGHRVFYP